MVGKVVANFRLTEKLGSGGMGVVWKASDLRLGREVAIKFLAAELTGERAHKDRFLREARAASSLNHPNIVTVFEVGSDGPADFIVMELLPGETLQSRLRKGAIEPQLAIRYGIQICDALACAHAAGLIHRDLKPGNIMITPQHIVKVLDFGLAKSEHAETAGIDDDTRTNSLTVPGEALGTMKYMSPEQISGDPLDFRSDIFSFGIVLYEMLTKRVPFDASTSARQMKSLLLDHPPPLVTPEGEKLPALEAIVLRCLSKEQDNRYSSAQAVAADLYSLLDSDSRAPGLLSGSFLLPVGSRKRIPRWTIVTAAACALALAAAGAWRWTDITPRLRAVLPRTASDLTREARQLLERYDKPENLTAAFTDLDSAIQLDPGFAPAYAALAEANVRRNLADHDAQRLNVALSDAQKAIQLNPDLAFAQVALGDVLFESGKQGGAKSAYQTALALDPRNADALLGLARLSAKTNDRPATEIAFQKAIHAAPTSWRPHGELGIYFYRQGRFSDAAASFESARVLAPDNVTLLRNLSASYHMLDRDDEAASIIQRALEIRPNATLYTNLGTLRFYQGRYAEDVPAMEKAVELDPNNYIHWINLADAYRWAPGSRPKSIEPYRHAIEMIDEKRKSQPSDPDLIASKALCFAKLKSETAKIPGLLAELKQVPVQSVSSRYKAAEACEISGDRMGALAWLSEAIDGGYSMREIRNDPELLSLRADRRYHSLESKAISAKAR